MANLSDLRLELAQAKADLREARDDLTVVQAAIERQVIDEAGGSRALGANERDRERALTLALNDQASYTRALAALRDRESEIERLEAEIQNAEDERRRHEYAVRAQVAEALTLLCRSGIRFGTGATAALDAATERAADGTMAHVHSYNAGVEALLYAPGLNWAQAFNEPPVPASPFDGEPPKTEDDDLPF